MLQIYCGDGKGKTTASVGLAVRAAGAGKKVGFFQFLKDGSSSEINVLKQIGSIHTEFCEPCSKFLFQMNESELDEVKSRQNEMLRKALDMLDNGDIELLILDEFAAAYNKNTLDRALADKVIFEHKDDSEIVLTGREPDKKFIGSADYVSEIAAVKHPYTKGIAARKGIEY
ncbi:MAG: cob(I)yrinic acid a,c-diamide adenosyltransferase [Ruminococcus sp.]|nr:cob(I)yrinic acid a,c-diamide adenosyltransferase [Ruminococcus sp.]